MNESINDPIANFVNNPWTIIVLMAIAIFLLIKLYQKPR
jgi:hypothetical protein